MTANEYANLALKVLKEHKATYGARYGLATKSLASRMGVADTSRDTLLKVLEKLALLKIIQKHGTGKFLWAINVEEWDQYSPFRAPPQATPSYTPVSPAAPSYGGAPETTNNSELEEALTESRLKVQEYENIIRDITSSYAKQKDLLEAKEKELAEAGRAVKVLKIERYDGSKETIKDVVLPPQFDDVKDLAECRMNVLLVGPAGCGKSHLAELIAKTLGLGFGSVSCTAGMSEAHLLGRSMPNLANGDEKFHGTDFLDCYENGGVYLFDELDAADPNLLLCVNTALANGYCNVPTRSKKARAKKHTDFVCIATANTFGRGATRVYSGRNQLDEATLDRFRMGIVEMDYDAAVEKALCPDDELRGKLTKMRERIIECGLTRRILSTRFMSQAYTMRSKKQWSVDKIVNRFFSGWPKDERTKVENGTTTKSVYGDY